MEIMERDDEYSLTIYVCIHRAIVKTFHILKTLHKTPNAVFIKKQNIVEELSRNYKEKDIINAWRKVDSRFEEIYKNLYPHGGYRKNSGRPTGSRTKRTERLNNSVTPEEKAAVEDLLKRMRQNENKI